MGDEKSIEWFSGTESLTELRAANVERTFLTRRPLGSPTGVTFRKLIARRSTILSSTVARP